jgi:hypothetical protein
VDSPIVNLRSQAWSVSLGDLKADLYRKEPFPAPFLTKSPADGWEPQMTSEFAE